MFVLVDTSIWIDHLRKKNTLLSGFLEEGVVLMHPCVRGELALGHLTNRSEVLGLIEALPEAELCTDDEVMHVIEKRKVWGSGLGWIDAHLLASSLLTNGCKLWTKDGALRRVALKVGAPVFHGAA